MKIFVNGRFRAHQITGLQRYAHEVTSRLSGIVHVCQPRQKLKGWRGHFWEQAILPLHSRSGVLWSPCAAGPLTAPKHVVTFHDLFPLDSPEWYTTAYVAWYRVLLKKLAKTAIHIIAVSEYTKRRIVERLGVNQSKISVVHNGVDESFFRTPRFPSRAVRSALKLPSARYLLCVGSLEPRKNLTRLMAAWAQIVSDLPSDLWLVVAGSSDRSVYGSAGIEKLPPRVFLTGYVPDCFLIGLYAGSLGFIYPSLAEGFGLPPLEAMACGVPVLTSRVTALPEVCASAVLYADPTNVADISRSIKLLVIDASARERLSALGRERAGQFTWERTAEQTLRVLTGISNSKNAVTNQ